MSVNLLTDLPERRAELLRAHLARVEGREDPDAQIIRVLATELLAAEGAEAGETAQEAAQSPQRRDIEAPGGVYRISGAWQPGPTYVAGGWD